MADDPNRVWPSGLTTAEAEELQKGLVDGTRTFGFIALLAHFLEGEADAVPELFTVTAPVTATDDDFWSQPQ